MSVSTDLPPLDGSYEWNHTIGGLLCLNLSLSIMFSSCIHVVECIGTHFFLLLNNIPLFHVFFLAQAETRYRFTVFSTVKQIHFVMFLEKGDSK